MKDNTIRPKVSIIIPVYNVEKYIERCVRTLFAQTLAELEYIFVDDFSPDGSMDVMFRVLEEYPGRKSQVKLIRHKGNQGVSRSRQDGIDAATGEYIIHCDPDDWVELDMYEQLYNKAKETNAEIVICDYYEENGNETIVKHQYIPEHDKILKNIVSYLFHMATWNKLIDRKFLNRYNIRFLEGVSLWEDMAFNIPLICQCNNLKKLENALYHYDVSVPNSIVKSCTLEKIKSQIKCVRFIEEYLVSKSLICKNDIWLSILKINAKNSLLLPGESFNPVIWRDTFSEVNKCFYKLPISLGQKLLYQFTIFRMDKLVKKIICLRKPLI